MAQPPSIPPDMNEYSPSSTIICFDSPIPLLRRPIPAAEPDNPSHGPFVLGFKDQQSWASAYKSCEAQIVQQCEAGARIGCSISASNKCKPPWWKTLIGLSSSDFEEREVCEVREMELCLQDSKAKCLQFAKDKCFPVFSDARIAVNFNFRNVNSGNVGKLIALASMVDKRFEFLRAQFEVTNYRGSKLLGDNLNTPYL